MTLIINIQKKYLIFRREAETILKEALKKKKTPQNVYLDFSKVNFFSRSFVDELLNVIEELRKRKISVRIQSFSPQLKKMLFLTRKTKTKIQKEIASKKPL